MNEQEKRERLRKDARTVLDAAIEAADPERAVERCLKREGDRLFVGCELELDLTDYARILTVGAGKAGASMARALERILGDRIAGGLISVKYGHGLPLQRIELAEAAHPVPDRSGAEAAERIIGILESAGENDLVFSLISGGGSALIPAAAPPVTLELKRRLTERLLAAGADIHEINTVRKHLSRSKGGNLMRAAYPARVINLMLSDVIGDDPDVIASGPFVPDTTSFADAERVLVRYGLTDSADPEIVERIRDGVAGLVPENPKEYDPIFDRATNMIVGSNIRSLTAAAYTARELGYGTLILSSSISGDTTDAARFHAAIAEEIRRTGNPVKSPACIVSGGETTVKVTGAGLGGRNQEFALALVEAASRIPGALFLAAGTDGTDGPTDAAGAIADDRTLGRAREMGMEPRDFLRNNDSYHFFERLGDLIVTGPTRTNVMDVRVVLVGEAT
jgi:hydroxypyruvate reductase